MSCYAPGRDFFTSLNHEKEIYFITTAEIGDVSVTLKASVFNKAIIS